MHDILLCAPKILGTINQYVIPYELQSRCQVDIQQITNEIAAAIPTIFDTTFVEFLEPTNSHQNKLFKIGMRKLLHTCDTDKKNSHNDCKYGFLFKPHIEYKTIYNPETKRWSITSQGTRTAMLSLIMHPCCWCGVHI